MNALGHSGLEPTAEQPGAEPVTLATHPRAAGHIRRAKGWGGLLAFAIVGLLSWHAGIDAFEAGLRAVAAGIVGFMVAWALSIYAWRLLVEAEQRIAQEPASTEAAGDPERPAA